MRDQSITVRLPQSLIDALDNLAMGDGLGRQARSVIIRELLAEGVRAGQRRPSR